MKIGMLGGSFNPIHTGHLILAQECWHRLKLDKVIFIPSYIQPLKTHEEPVSPADRLNMARLAVHGDARFEVCTHELDKGGVSYSIDTIKHLREKYGPKAELYFLTGSDSAEAMSMWKDIDEILRLTRFVIVARPGWGAQGDYESRVTRLEMPAIEISSTMIRERVKDRQPIDYLVPRSVAEFIRDKGLYR